MSSVWDKPSNLVFLRDHYNNGLTQAEIARRLQISKSAVAGKAYREGLTTPVQLVGNTGTIMRGPKTVSLAGGMYADLTKPFGERIVKEK
jgi:hypothetical protein